MTRHFVIKVPASSANIGPGFDVLGIGLSLFLELDVTIDPKFASETNNDPHNCVITYSEDSEGFEHVPLKADENLITRTALYVLRCNDIREFPIGTKIHIKNPIPLGRGLGSSGAAVVGGAMLGNEIGKLGFSKERILDYCLMIERHPDNITAAMMGGFVGSYLRDLSAADMERKEIPLSEVLPEPAGGHNTGLAPPIPPHDIGRHIKYDWCKQVKCVAIIPDFEVSTASSRGVLPTAYTAKDMIFNLQRLAVLTTALTRSPPDPELIYPAMQDRVHQPYRKTLIPGLTEILSSVTPKTHPGLLGICLSGAGPTILALATENFEEIANEIINRFAKEKITCRWKLLEPAYEGATVEELDN
ncbi:homoserine kinase [Cyberlindnera jadinii NRRL Y-1542]|uniref:Homoserine kinase n=1 Tax=Cyberlindnera jadinii (strain ATCC 18201 / CBS 1600 / BCRC 20928 / JCM 3617 / NBRC 0987 / NRRL Y-1542) TaxID=983966 RepID=A0A1E4S8X7_CYBJN|nr:homoserine kinase [Cyberlindnera jadinii NRRL Y-1542]ODV75852.1 homoserine kinase [Cyberlindnera jadinii NRRL Y-1542]